MPEKTECRMRDVTVKELQQQVRLSAVEKYADDLVKLAASELWLGEIALPLARCSDTLFRLEVDHNRTGFGGDDSNVARLRRRFERNLARLLHLTIMVANAEKIDLAEAMHELLQEEGE